VTKLNSSGSSLVYSTYLGGSGTERGNGIALDAAGEAYVTGHTDSTDFPITPATAFQTTPGPIFMTKLDVTGSAEVYSTFFDNPMSARGDSGGNAIAVDDAGAAYVTGITYSSNFPLRAPFQTSYGGGNGDAFVAKFDPTASGSASLVWSSYLGGSDEDKGMAIAVDYHNHDVYVAGYTLSTDYPTVNPYQSTNGGYQDAFVAKISFGGAARGSTVPLRDAALAAPFDFWKRFASSSTNLVTSPVAWERLPPPEFQVRAEQGLATPTEATVPAKPIQGVRGATHRLLTRRLDQAFAVLTPSEFVPAPVDEVAEELVRLLG
jgi:hypothetical protein